MAFRFLPDSSIAQYPSCRDHPLRGWESNPRRQVMSLHRNHLRVTPLHHASTRSEYVSTPGDRRESNPRHSESQSEQTANGQPNTIRTSRISSPKAPFGTRLVRMTGFEPATSRHPSEHSTQTELHPVTHVPLQAGVYVQLTFVRMVRFELTTSRFRREYSTQAELHPDKYSTRALQPCHRICRLLR